MKFNLMKSNHRRRRRSLAVQDVWTALSNSFAHVLPDIINREGVNNELLIPAANHKKVNNMFWLSFTVTKEKLHNVDGRCEGMLSIFTQIIS